MKYIIEEKETINLAGTTIKCKVEEASEIRDLFWNKISNNNALNKIHEVKTRKGILEGRIIGVWKEVEDGINYFIGTEYNLTSSIYSLELLTIPKSNYMIHKGTGKIPEVIDESKEHLFNKVLLDLDYKYNINNYIEVYSDERKSDEDYEYEIWIPISKEQGEH